MELNIIKCQHNGWSRLRSCSHSEDVSVSCITVRLVQGPSPHQGRLEVHYNGTWETVCSGGFDNADASVVCQMLKYGRTGRVIGNHYGAGNGTIWLDNVQCSGQEWNIAYCLHSGWGNHSCMHRADVSVVCPSLRLIGGPGPHEGRLEVYYNGIWGTVCDDKFDNADANVVCYMLGYGHSGRSINNRYGAGSGRIWLDEVQCRGTETSIAECQHRTWGINDCSHSEDVSVSCPTVRLVGGPSLQEGRLEVRYNYTWGTVCHDYFNDAAAEVICYMLGYGRVGHVTGNHYGAGSGRIWLDDVEWNGTERNITDCQHRRWGSHDCGHVQDISIACVSVRLVGGINPQEGRLEVYFDKIWGTVCHDYFNNEAAGVVCYMLGYGHGGQVTANRYGAGNGTIWLDDVRCSGVETSISGCHHSGWGHHNCRHDEDVAVSCIIVRLVGGPSPREGRLEVRYKGT